MNDQKSMLVSLLLTARFFEKSVKNDRPMLAVLFKYFPLLMIIM